MVNKKNVSVLLVYDNADDTGACCCKIESVTQMSD